MSSPPPPVPGSDHAATTEGTLDRALALVRFLRAHCPWDAEQTPRSLVPHLIEETHEVVDAIHGAEPSALGAELGDLLLNLAFQVVLGEEAGHFDAESVTAGLEEKMARRHPHLYGRGEKQDWATLKAQEGRRAESILDGVPPSLDPLSRAFRMQERVAAVGFDWDDYRGAVDKVDEELAEVKEALSAGDGATAHDPQDSRGGAAHDVGEDAAQDAIEEELGDLLFAVVNVIRLARSHPVTALGRANRKFQRRFDALETLAGERGVVLGEATLDELDHLWDEVKKRERG